MTEAMNQDLLEDVTADFDVQEQREDTQQKYSFISEAADFFRRNALKFGVISAAAVGVGAMEPDISIANQKAQAKPTPIGLMNYVNTFYERTIASWGGVASNGAMNNIEHMSIGEHSYQLSAACNITAKYSSNANTVSFVRNNLKGDYEISCADGDVPVQHNFAPLKIECNNSTFVNCLTMNMVPALEEDGKTVETYISEERSPRIAKVKFNKVVKLIVDNYKGKSESDAKLYFSHNSSVAGKQAKELIITKNKNRETFTVELYPKGSIAVK